MKERPTPREIKRPQEVRVEPVTADQMPEYVGFLSGIIGDSPFYTEAQKAHLINTATVETMTARLDDPASQLLQARSNDEKIVGFAVGKVRDFDDAFKDVGYVSWVGVDVHTRGTGVATELIHGLEEGFKERNADTAVCFIKDANTASRRRFASEGYVEEPRIVSPTGGTDGKFYKKDLDDKS